VYLSNNKNSIICRLALGNNSNYFYSPTEVAQGKAPIDRSFRLGGMVAVGSFKREDLKSTFDVTDYKNKFSIEYTGILPDLFREGQGIITTGSLVNGRFIATEVLASWRIKIIAIITECLK
jgi:cytochrome c-type biogenesis protein CcmE